MMVTDVLTTRRCLWRSGMEGASPTEKWAANIAAPLAPSLYSMAPSPPASLECQHTGISRDVLKDFGVRLIAIDRPGYGASDPHPNQTLQNFTVDIETLVERLHLGEKIWLLGYSIGSIYCWAALRYIPHRVAGVALWAPAANFEWKIFNDQALKIIKQGFSWKAMRDLYFQSRRAPFPQFRQYVEALCRHLLDKGHKLDAFQKGLPPSDIKALEQAKIQEFMCKDRLESIGGLANGFGVAKDFQLLTAPWGFEADELTCCYRGVVHIWQGDKDTGTSPFLQEVLQKKLPFVRLHRLNDEGHFSWFYFNSAAHKLTLDTLFGCNQCIRAKI
ncbi:hypothetical protein KP509_04G050100 [Ceratopteris richardii]|uniref:AB hydrolase-1 domain-containing protein n=1 Tax=Ceratopteris richardii TaxID=49495 RepID=A0A8T2USU1_CERRI|nr:hypothetical protein KP509_04G050100 [Ceratopteris richardii]